MKRWMYNVQCHLCGTLELNLLRRTNKYCCFAYTSLSRILSLAAAGSQRDTVALANSNVYQGEERNFSPLRDIFRKGMDDANMISFIEMVGGSDHTQILEEPTRQKRRCFSLVPQLPLHGPFASVFPNSINLRCDLLMAHLQDLLGGFHNHSYQENRKAARGHTFSQAKPLYNQYTMKVAVWEHCQKRLNAASPL